MLKKVEDDTVYVVDTELAIAIVMAPPLRVTSEFVTVTRVSVN